MVAEWLVIVAREFYFEDGHNYESFWDWGSRSLWLVARVRSFHVHSPSATVSPTFHTFSSPTTFLVPTLHNMERRYECMLDVSRAWRRGCTLVSLCGSRRHGRRTPRAFPKLNPCECVGRNEVNRRNWKKMGRGNGIKSRVFTFEKRKWRSLWWLRPMDSSRTFLRSFLNTVIQVRTVIPIRRPSFK